MEENLPPGFRFHPTDEELITFYLTHKISDLEFTSKAIADVDLNKCEPWDLPAKASMGEKEWYFFSLRDRKYPTGLRTNRATEAGYWKTTGKDKEIYRDGLLVGMKKTLVFYKGRAPKGEKTNWVMHEYRLQTNHSFRPSKDEWVVCRVFKKNATIKRPQLTSSLDQQSPDSPDETNINISNELGDIELPNLNLFSTSSSREFSHPDHLPNFTNTHNSNLNLNSDLNMSNLNWLPPLSSWSSSLLSPSLNSAMNSLLVKALQVRNMTDYSTYTQQMGNIMPQFGANFTSSTSLPNIIVSSTSNNINNIDNQATTRSELVHDHQQQQQQEQPFNWTPFVE